MSNFKTFITASLAAAALSMTTGCVSGGEDPGANGMAVEQGLTYGPSIVFDPLAQPFPEVPFPNDLTLVPSDETEAGSVWNVSLEKPSVHTRRIRELLNGLDGFGSFAPAFLSFDGPLDLSTVSERTVMIVNIEPGHPREGEMVPLDLGQGYFPTSTRKGGFFGSDPEAESYDLFFPEDNLADVNGDGVLERVTHYEVSSNTLIIRPVIPLAQGCRHAVLITKGVQGYREVDGDQVRAPIRSPFPNKAHSAQTTHVKRALKLAGVRPVDLAFGWTYTTADLITPMQTIRDGLYGEGPLARMEGMVKQYISVVRDTGIPNDADGDRFPLDKQDHQYILQAEFMSGIFGLIAQIQGSGNYNLDLSAVDYLVMGTIQTPDLRMGDRRDFNINTFTGEGDIGTQEVPFLLTVPKPSENFKPPFDVMFYFHGTGTSRMEALAIAHAAAQQGIAVFAIDEVGHGPLIPDIPTLVADNADNPSLVALLPALPRLLASVIVPDRLAEFTGISLEEAIEKFNQIGFFAELAVYGRSEDENGDGKIDIAEAFFFADPFRQCSSFWQDMVDMMQGVKVLRAYTQEAVPPGLADPSKATYEELEPYLRAGDFNADGILDVGGPGAHFSSAGTSLGGFHSVITAANEPEITSVSPIVAGGGFTDIMVRSSLRMITSRIFLDVLGQVVVGCPTEDGKLHISLNNGADGCKRPEEGQIHVMDMPEAGTVIGLVNEDNGEQEEGVVQENGGFSIAVESDRGDSLVLLINGEPVVTTNAIVDGGGYRRNSKDFRRAINVQQHVFDRCDPINFARQLAWEPIEGHPTTNSLFLLALGDDTVPVSTGVLLSLAAGAFGTERRTWEPAMKALISKGVLEGEFYDVDDFRGDNGPDMPALGLTPGLPTEAGLTTVRFADVNGKHEWIAGYNRDDFEFGIYSQNQLSIYHRCRGVYVPDGDPECLQTRDCEGLNDFPDQAACLEAAGTPHRLNEDNRPLGNGYIKR